MKDPVLVRAMTLYAMTGAPVPWDHLTVEAREGWYEAGVEDLRRAGRVVVYQ